MNQLARRAKIKWQCRRGMLELDLILDAFLKTHFENLSDKELASLETLLSYPDPVIYHWLLGHEDTLDSTEIRDIVNLISSSHQP
ncbi:MAG: hypothetical protein CMF38_04440 [Legionellaceae bacterium]|nr:hypothetical protein [Legionellaceae bacterium]HAF87865.1 hypothetical protein [Legionellales bacterium]HCA89950.1 hypothetical protein [Legionellales bacterium]|tara:strand:+ start:1429 stop:1683 length:255 start_codon:yes stop_codon:yes gene_type:complete